MDLIDRQVAIKTLEKGLPSEPLKSKYTEGITVGSGLAITWIEQLPAVQTCEDAVSRADVLETFAELYDVFEDNKEIHKELHKVYDRINALPSAQPEIIRCEDCAKCQTDDVYHDYWCDGRKVWRDHFCGYAERRTDEQT